MFIVRNAEVRLLGNKTREQAAKHEASNTLRLLRPSPWIHRLSAQPPQGERDFWLALRFPQVCVQRARLTDEYSVSLNMASARNLRFLDREKEIIYPWTSES